MKLVKKVILVLITVAVAVTITLLGITVDNTVQAQGSIFTANSTGDAIDQCHPAQIAYSGDDIVVTMSLASVSDQLTFNQSHVEDNRLEFSWGVRIDTDGNVSTGDGSGYDVEISLTHFKPPGNSPFTGTILDGTQKNTWVLSGSSHLFAHNIEAAIDHDTKSIIMIAKQSWEEFADFDINDRFCCKTYYYSPSGSVQDITSDNPPGSNIVSDPEGDVSYSFVDITGGKVQLPDTIQPSVTVTDPTISAETDYSIVFNLGTDVAEGEDIIVEFPNDTYISGITDTDTDSDVTVAATSGTGSTAFSATAAGSSSADTTLTITVPDVNAEDKIGAGATVQVVVSGLGNPSVPAYYTLLVSTSGETTPVESNAYTITIPLHPPEPIVSIATGQNIISQANADYTISIGLGEELGVGNTITVTFPNDTVVSVSTANITASIGWIGGIYKDATLNAATWTADTATRTVTATLGTGDEVGELAWVWIEITASITNPSVPGDYTLTVHTSQETTPVESNAYTITTPPDPSLPGIVEVYSPSDILMAQFTGDDAITDAIASAGEDFTIKVYTGTYTTNVDVNVDHLTIRSENGPEVTTVRAANSNDHVFEVTADNVTISGFSIFGATGGFKAGIYLASNTHHCTISNNRCGYDGEHKNYIGIDMYSSSSNAISGNTCNSNSYHGIRLYNSSNNTIGGTTASVGNTIAFNGGDGVVVEVGIGNAIQSNSIFSNAGLGIDLGADGMTLNDPGDTDSGANNLQNFPVLTSATSGSTTIEGTLNSTPNTKFRLEFFANTECDPSGYGEGETFLGFIDVTTDGSGNVAFTVTFPDTVPGGHFITATAADPNSNTSEFSQCLQVIALEPDIRTPIDPIDFGGVGVGSSLDETTTLYNDGTATLTINTITRLSGSDEFTYVGPPTPFDIEPERSQVITIRFAPISAGLKSATFNINSNDPDEGLVEVALSGSAMQIAPATVDFDPDTLNLKSKGKWVTAYIELLEGYDIWDIDGGTVLLNDEIPPYLGKQGWAKAEANDSNIIDHDGDGIMERMVKFDRETVQAILELGDQVQITITGKVAGVSFKGVVTIRVIDKGKGK